MHHQSLVVILTILLPRAHCLKVLSTDLTNPLALTGSAEVLNSSLAGQKEVTLCARFLTHQFSILLSEWQVLLSKGRSKASYQQHLTP